MKKTLGEKLSELRREKGWRQDDVAEKLDVSPQAVSKWENDVSCPDIMMLPCIAKLYGVTVDSLFTDEEPAKTIYLPPEERKSIEKMMMHINVDVPDESIKVRLNLPVPFVQSVLASGGSIYNFMGGSVENINIDFDKLLPMIENGAVGKLVEVDADGHHVEIVVE